MAGIIKTAVTINKPVEQVWEVFMDPENFKHWLTGFISAEQLTGKAGEAGSTSRLKFMERGKEIEVIETVLLASPRQQFAMAIKHADFEVETDIRFVSFGPRTEMIQTEQLFPKGFFMKLFMPMIKGAMKKRMTEELGRFKSFAEGK